MDEVALVAAYIYFTFVISAVTYRGYGAFARLIVRIIARRALQRLLHGNSNIDSISKSINIMLIDDRITRFELNNFAELILLQFIDKRNNAIDELKKERYEKNEEVLLLTFTLSKIMLNDKYINEVVKKVKQHAEFPIFIDYFSKFLIDRRIKSYALDLSRKIGGNLEEIPRVTRSIVDKDVRDDLRISL